MSAVIRMTRNKVEHLDCDEQLFKRVVKTVFNQRRKMLRVSLKQLLTDAQLLTLFATPHSASAENSQLNLTLRPEQLSIDQFVTLTNMVEKALCTTTNDVCADTNT
jgi:16S rRNA (adenine1518-N6/adenine1519-N6)-dimethyltransferase